MKEQPVFISAIVQIVVPLIVGAAAKWGLNLDSASVASIMASLLMLLAALMAKWTHGKVAPLSKMARLTPDAHASYMAMTRKP